MITMISFLPNQWTWAQPPSSPGELVTYQKQSNFIKEFSVPFEELGLRGITTDSQGNAWFYHSTNTTSTLVTFNPDNGTFAKFPIGDKTVSDEPVINLASSQLAFDERRNAIWFTDARTNSIGRFDIEGGGGIRLLKVPASNAGPMGIALSPDGKAVWVAEITGDRIARVDAESLAMTEYSTGEDSGPTLLTFDDSGVLWATLSFSNSVLRIDTQSLLSSNPSSAMTELRIAGDSFSPFGIAVSGGKVHVSDHGSSRVIVSDVGFVNYVSYWTSPSMLFPTSLPSQVVADAQGNIYFPQHGGNRISSIDRAGVMSEYEIPTGPLSTAVFVAASSDGRKVWFTEWAANKVAYLDTAMQVPFTLGVEKTTVTLDQTGPKRVAASLGSTSSDAAEIPVSLSEVEIGLAGMTESGLKGVTYEAQPPRVNLHGARSAESEIQIRALENARPGSYVAMVRAFAPENDGLIVSRLYPFELVLDVPEPAPGQDSVMIQNSQQAMDPGVQHALRIAAPIGAAGVLAFGIYRWKKAKRRAC